MKIMATLLSVMILSTPVFANETLICNVTNITPIVSGLLSAQLKVQTRVSSAYEGSVTSVDLEKHMNDQRLVSDRIFGYGPWVRGIAVPDTNLCDHRIETSEYTQKFGTIRLMSRCGIPDSIVLRIRLNATLETSKPGTFNFSYPDTGEMKSVEISTAACAKF